MPYKSSLLTSPNTFPHARGVMALPQIRSRFAVPILIGLLRSPDVDVGPLASIGLIRLTHRSPLEGGQWFKDSPSNEYPEWIRWWMLQGHEHPDTGRVSVARLNRSSNLEWTNFHAVGIRSLILAVRAPRTSIV
jgi:hypothetical protein